MTLPPRAWTTGWRVAAPVDGFVGFAIGRSISEEPIATHNRGQASKHETIGLIARRYLRFAHR